MIAGVARQFMNAKVCFYEATEGANPYDPITGEGDEFGINILWWGKARVQQLRAPQTFATDYQASASKAFRFQLDREDGVPFLPQGVKARVLDAGVPGAEAMTPGDSDLERLAYVVNSAINASHQAVKTVELTANMKAVTWDWTLLDDGTVQYGWEK